MADDFCEKNFICENDEIYQDACFSYQKGPFDLECHIPCRIQNCTIAAVEFSTDCIVYHCIPNPGPSPSPSPPGPSPSPSPPGPSPSPPSPPGPSPEARLAIGFGTSNYKKQIYLY